MINRNAHLSLLESVNEAVVGKTVRVPTSKVTAAKAPAKVAAKATKATKPGAATKVTSTAATSPSNTAAGGQSTSSGLKWGDASIGGAMNAQELAKWLNSQSGAVVDKQSASVQKAATSGGAGLAEEEDFDAIDEILAEGLELYGEEGLEEILADFAETGEMSQELADLLGLE